MIIRSGNAELQTLLHVPALAAQISVLFPRASPVGSP